MQHLEPDGDGSPQRAQFCTACGTAAQAEARFCASCGTRLFSTATAIAPGDGGDPGVSSLSRLQAAQALLDDGSAQAAVPSLEALCAEFPQWTAAWVNLAIARLRAGRVHESEDALEVVEALAPGSFECEMAFAEFHARLGFYDRAAARLSRALDLTAPDARARDTAVDLHRYCTERAKKMFYRSTPLPQWTSRLRLRRSPRNVTSAATPISARSN